MDIFFLNHSNLNKSRFTFQIRFLYIFNLDQTSLDYPSNKKRFLTIMILYMCFSELYVSRNVDWVEKNDDWDALSFTLLYFVGKSLYEYLRYMRKRYKTRY